jgi:glycosyltransferase involved in cell wall biosynthesis
MGQSPAKPIPILLASSLKPVKDVRAWEKLGHSLRETNTYSLNIIGFSGKMHEHEDGVNFFSSQSSFDSTWKRVISQLRFIRLLVKIKPKILICCTYEYLPAAALFKKLLNFKLVYDVQENYIANLALNPNLTAKPKERATRIIQNAESVNGIDLYLFAEKCYWEEMPEKRPFLVLENKYSGLIKPIKPIRFPLKKGYKFVITGTITPAFGILDAVLWFKSVLLEFPESRLTIIGHLTLSEFGKELSLACQNVPAIEMTLSEIPVAHGQLIHAMTGADFALLPYQNPPAIKDKMPTKLFEAAALGIPVLINPNQKWEDFLKPFSGGSPVDFSKAEEAGLQLSQALKLEYFTTQPDHSISWDSQKSDFLKAIKGLLS